MIVIGIILVSLWILIFCSVVFIIHMNIITIVVIALTVNPNTLANKIL